VLQLGAFRHDSVMGKIKSKVFESLKHEAFVFFITKGGNSVTIYIPGQKPTFPVAKGG